MDAMKPEDNVIMVESGKIRIRCTVSHREEEGYWNAHIPAFDIHFSSPAGEDALKKRAEIAMRAFADYWVKGKSMKDFVVKIHLLGFRTPSHDSKMHELLNNRRSSAKFNNRNIKNLEGYQESAQLEAVVA